MKTEIIKVGEVGVDSGTIWIGDPCYILHKGKNLPASLGDNWGDFCKIINSSIEQPLKKQFNCEYGHAGLGVCVSSGYGDGVYEVFAEVSDEGDWGIRIKKVWIEFF